MFTRSKEKRIIRKSHLFDPFYYLKENMDVRQADIDPLEHFIDQGWKERRNPSEFFDTKYYLDNNSDIAESGINPLVHFLTQSFSEGRKAIPAYKAYPYWCRFQSKIRGLKKLISMYRDVITIHKNGLFDKDFYLAQNPDVKQRFIHSIYWKWRDSSNPLLRAIGKWKTATVLHYVFHGVYEGRDPNNFFSTAFYINENPDLLKYNYINPFVHFIQHGQAEGRLTNDETLAAPLSGLMQYSIRFIRELGKGEKNRQVTVITEFGADIEETRQRIESICSQSHRQIELLVLHWQNDSEILQFLEEISGSTSIQMKLISTTIQKKNDGSMWQDALRQAASELIWLVPASDICDPNFLDELTAYFADESVMAAYCPTHISTVEGAKSKSPADPHKEWTSTAIRWVHHFSSLEEMELHRAAFIFRNIFKSNLVEKEIPALAHDKDFRDFILNLIHGGAIAFTNSTSHQLCEDKYPQQKGKFFGEEFWKDQRKLLASLHARYQLSPDKIRELYEKERTAVLIHDPQKLNSFIHTMDIEKILQEKTGINIMLSIFAFSLGGGEIMPIRLANQYKQMGHSVLIHSMKMNEESDSKVREMLDPGIPVVFTKKTEELAMILREFEIDVINSHHQVNQSLVANVLNGNPDLHAHIFHIGTSHGMYEGFAYPMAQLIFDRMRNGVDHWTYVADKNLLPFQAHNFYQEEKFTKIPNGMKAPDIQSVDTTGMGIAGDSFLCCLASRAIPEKGWQQAIEAIKIARESSNKDIHLILIGDGEIYQQLLKEEVPAYIHLMGFRDNPCDYFAISDICLLPSYYRSESAPLTLIEALLCHKPVIASNIGDVTAMLTINGELAGDVFALQDWTVPVAELAQMIVRYATDAQYYQKKKTLAELKSRTFDIANVALRYIDVYMKQKSGQEPAEKNQTIQDIAASDRLLSNAVLRKDSLRVSVIVPNYNHEKYLRQRLDSIYNQTYKNYEVILLDDCSTDHSREILKEYAEKHKDNTRIIFNEKNSGGVYHQWAKGIQNASSEYCWIAESDDDCESNFLEKVIPAFNDPEVKLSYCQYGFIDPENVENPGAFLNYVGAIDREKWKNSYINDSSSEVETALAMKNTIPNASGAVFKKPVDDSLLKNDAWLSMRICGDWIFYLHIIRDGKIAFTTATKSYFRFHTSNTSVATYATAAYYKEHEMVALAVKSLYDVSDQAILKNYENIHAFFDRNVHDRSLIFEELFNIQKVLSHPRSGR